MQYRPDLGEEETLGDLKERARNTLGTLRVQKRKMRMKKKRRKKGDTIFWC
jgi:hypothetical protein